MKQEAIEALTVAISYLQALKLYVEEDTVTPDNIEDTEYKVSKATQLTWKYYTEKQDNEQR